MSETLATRAEAAELRRRRLGIAAARRQRADDRVHPKFHAFFERLNAEFVEADESDDIPPYETYDTHEGDFADAPDGVEISDVDGRMFTVPVAVQIFGAFLQHLRWVRSQASTPVRLYCLADGRQHVDGDAHEALVRALADVPNAPVREVVFIVERMGGIYLFRFRRMSRGEMKAHFARSALGRHERHMVYAKHYAPRDALAGVERARRCHADRVYMDGDAVPDSARDGGRDNVSFVFDPADEMATCYRRSELLRYWSQDSNQEYVGVYHSGMRSAQPGMTVFKMPYEGVWVIDAYRVLHSSESRLFLLQPIGVSGIGTARFGVGTLHGEEYRVYAMVPETRPTNEELLRRSRLQLPNWDVTWHYEERDDIFEQSDDDDHTSEADTSDEDM